MNRTAPTDRRDLVLVAIVLLVVGAMWAPALLNDFTMDDNSFVRAETPFGSNVMVQELRPLTEYFSRPYGYGVASVTRGFRPLTVWSYALTYHGFRQPSDELPGGFTDRAWPHHLVNLLLHLVATALVYAMTTRLTGPGVAALAATLVFGVHALRAEAVVSIVGRGELLGFVFGAASLLLWLRGQETARIKPLWLGLSALTLFLAFCSKENALAWTLGVPLFAVVVDRSRRKPLGASLRRQATTAAVVVVPPLVAYLALRANMLAAQVGSFEAVRNPLFAADWDLRVRTGTMVLGYGLYKVLWPFRLVCDYGARVFEPVTSWWDVRFLTAAVVLAALLAGFLFALRAAPLLASAAAFFLGWGFLTSNIPLPIETIFGERLYYAPALGLSFAVAWVVTRSRGRPAVVVAVLLTLWAGTSLWTGVRRSFEWRDNRTLYLTDAERQPRSVWLAVQAARWHHDHGDPAERDRHLERALDLDPEYGPALVTMFEARAREGFALEERDPRAAAAAFRESERWGRRALASPRLDLLRGQKIRQNVAVVLARLGRLDEARREHARVIDVAPATRVAFLSRVESAWLAYAIEKDQALPEIRGLADALPRDLPTEQRLAFLALVTAFEGMAALDGGDPQRASRLLDQAIDTLERVAPELIRDELRRALAQAS